MLTKLRNRMKRQDGFAYTWDMVFAVMCCFCLAVIAWGSLGSKVLGEVGDLGAAIGSLNQSYTITGLAVGHPNDPNHPTDIATWSGSSFVDTTDFCDQSASCGIRNCVPPTPEAP